jgi:hypothetical protein
VKLQYLILVLAFSFAANNLFGQTNHPAKKVIGSYDAASQSNVDVIASGNMDDAVPCPPEYTNVISNTNLFTPDEQQLLKEAQLYLTNNTYSGPIIHHVRDKSGNGYDLYDGGLATGSGFGGVGGGSHEYWFIQIKDGVNDGLKVEIEHDHCVQWLCYSNGWAVDKWLQWSAYGNKLILWAKFKEPFDIDRTHNRNLEADANEARAYAILGKRDECYDTARDFYRQTSRWPTNMIELSAFARLSKDRESALFDPSFYKEVKFSPKTDGNLEIRYQSRDTFLGRDETVVDVDKPTY